MKKPEIPNLKLIIASSCAVVALLAALAAMLVVLTSMEDPLISLNVSMTSTPTFSMEIPSSEPDSSQEEPASSEEASSAPASSSPPVSSRPPQSSAPVSSAPASSEPAASEEAPPESETSSEEETPPEVPDRPDGITRIELVNISGGQSGDLPPEQFDEFLMHLSAISFEDTEEEIDSSVAADARIRIYRGENVETYTVYPFWAWGSRVLLELQGGKDFLQYLKTLEVFAGQSFPY